MARFHGRQTAVGSVKVNGNKGVLRAYKAAMTELIEERRKNTPIKRTKAYRLGRVDAEGHPITKTNVDPVKPGKRTRRRKKKSGVDDMAALLAKKFNSNERMKSEEN